MTEALEILEAAISDVGYWSWWAEQLPDTFQAEFCGVQLWIPPMKEGLPPSGQIALRFTKPSSIVFLRRILSPQFPLADDWYENLRGDNIEPFNVDHEAFTLTSHERAKAILQEAKSRSVYHSTYDLHDVISQGSFCAFWAGPVGLYVAAESMTVCSHHGDIAFEALKEMSHSWWDYWRDYWNQKDSDNPMPIDYACDATVPLADKPA